MIGSLFAGMVGLNVNSTSMTVLGDNIANVNTTAFKSNRSSFANILASSLGGSVTSDVGRGVQFQGTTPMWTQGTIENTNNPTDMAINGSGFFVLQDGDGANFYSRAGEFHFDRNGNLLSSFGSKGSGNGEFRFPLGIDIDKSGKVYIADSGNHRLQVFSPEGKFIDKINIHSKDKHPADPTDVVVDDTRNRCYIVDNDNHYILVYDLSNRKLIKTYGSPGAGKLAFRYPFLITLDKDKYLYIVDVINTRVQVLNPDGLFVAFIGGWGVEKGEFFRPKGVAIDRNNRVYVSDSYMGVIQIFDSNGEFYAVVGDPAKRAPKKFKTPMGLFIDNNNRLYVVEMLANRVSVYRIETE